MSMISEQVKELRETAELFDEIDDGRRMLLQAADTIEALSAKLETANKELERWHTDKINDKIKNPFAWTSTLCCHNCDHKDEYIEELEAADMERSSEDSGGWIPCEDRLPQRDETVLIDTGIGYFEIATYSGDGKTFYTEECGSSNAVAWQPLPEPYHEP